MQPEPQNTISEITRRAIIDYISISSSWSGVLEETDFLARIYKLDEMRSSDYRFKTATGDIWQHRINNDDWPNDWVFTDARFGLRDGSDEAFLRFLAETVHPVTRPDTAQAKKIVREYNSYLEADGWELHVLKEISRKPVFGFRRILDGISQNIQKARVAVERLSGAYMFQQIDRLEQAVSGDPELAIGTAKEFLESLCKTILIERSHSVTKDEDLPALVKATVKSLAVVPQGLASIATAEKSITVLLNSLGSVAHRLAELRNSHGTGHGKPMEHVGLEKRHAKLAVGAATTLALFLFDCHEADRKKASVRSLETESEDVFF